MSLSKYQIIDLLSRFAGIGSDIVMGAVLTYSVVKTWSKFISTSFVISRIGSAKTVSIYDLRTFLESESGGHPREKLVIVRGIIKGIVKNRWSPCKTLVSKEARMEGVVLQQTWGYVEFDEILKNFYRDPWSPRKTTSLETVPFALSGRGSHDYVVVNLEGSTQPLPLTTTLPYDSNLPIQTFFFGSVLVEEKLLQFGRVINAVGICSVQDGCPQIKSCSRLPYFLTDYTQDQMVEPLAHQKSDFLVRGIILGLLSLVFCSYIFNKYWRPDIANEQSCGLCHRRRQKYASEPCGHVVCCERCAPLLRQISDLNCNFCTKRVKTFVRIGS